MARVPVGAYVPGDSFFHRAHPFVKFYWVFSFVVFCFYNKNPYINYALTVDRKSTRLNSSHSQQSRMPSSA